jgi:hypothetical protein
MEMLDISKAILESMKVDDRGKLTNGPFFKTGRKYLGSPGGQVSL